MAGIVYDLKEVLEQEKECYEALCTLAKYKTEATVTKKVEFLSEVIEREEEFIGRLNILNVQRESLMSDIALVTGINVKEITLTKIINKIGEHTEICQELKKCREDILKSMDQLKRQNHINTQVLKQSIEYVDFALNAIKTTQFTQTNVNYVKPGMSQELQSISTFDQRQ